MYQVPLEEAKVQFLRLIQKATLRKSCRDRKSTGNFDDFLKEQDLLVSVEAVAVKRGIVFQIAYA